MEKIKPYLISIAIAIIIGSLSLLLNTPNMNIYSEVHPPAISHTSSIFPIVCTILYVLMSILAALVYINKAPMFAKTNCGLKFVITK